MAATLDEYLKRRGWKESVPTREYMVGLRRSVLSLYEVSEVVPGESLALRDLVRGGDPHDSPHFHRGPKVSAKTGSSASMTANRSINGSSRSSGMVDINS